MITLDGISVLDEPTYPELTTTESEGTKNLELYAYASNSQRKWSSQASEDLKFYGGAHWTDEQIDALNERGQMPAVIQTTYQLVEQAVDMLTANAPSFRAAAVEDSDTETAKVFSDLFQWMWNASRGQSKIRQVVRDSYVQGRGVAHPYMDPNADFGKGEVLWTDLDPKSIYPDPASTDPLWDDAAFVLTRQLFTGNQVQKLYPDVYEEVKTHGRLTNHQDLPYTDSQATTNNEIIDARDIQDSLGAYRYEIIERYEKIIVKHFRFANPETGKEEVLSEAEYEARLQAPAYLVIETDGTRPATDPQEVAAFDELYNAYGPEFHQMVSDGAPIFMAGPMHEEAIPDSYTQLVPTTIGGLIEEGAVTSTAFGLDRIRVITTCGEIELSEFVLPTSHYPLVAFPASYSRNPYPTSKVRRVRDPQKIVNKTLSLILAHAANSTNVKVFYPDGTIKDIEHFTSEFGKAGGAMIPYDPAFGVGGGSPGGIVIAAPSPLPTALYANMDRALALMERILGVYSAQEGDPSQQAQTFRGTLALDEMGHRRMKGVMDQHYVSLKRLGEIMLDYAQHTYRQEKVIRLLNPSGASSQSEANIIQYDDVSGEASRINDITRGSYDLVVLAGSTSQTNRQARREEAMELFREGIYDDIQVLKSSEDPDAEEILQRKSIYAQMQQALGQYEQELKKLQGDLQTAERKAVNADQRVEVEKAKTRLNAILLDMEKNAEIFKDRLKQHETKNNKEAA